MGKLELTPDMTKSPQWGQNALASNPQVHVRQSNLQGVIINGHIDGSCW